MKSLLIKIACCVIGVLAITVFVRTAIRQHREYYRDGIHKLITPSEWSETGREAKLVIGENPYDEVRFVLITHHSAIAPNWNKIDPRTTYSTADPVMGLKSTWRIVTNSDQAQCGLWVDGDRMEFGVGICVVYISETHRATRVEILPGEECAFADAVDHVAYSNQAFSFIDKWILPRLPPAPPGPTVDEIIESLESKRN